MHPVVHTVKHFLAKNGPAILLASGIAGVAATAALTAKAASEATDRIRNKEVREDRTLSRMESFKLTWMLYIPPAIAGAVTIASIVTHNNINAKRSAALLSLYTASETTLRKYKEKVTEAVGKNASERLHDDAKAEVAKERMKESSHIYLTNSGETLFWDEPSGRPFKSDLEKIRRIENDINRDILRHDYLHLNSLYGRIGLPTTSLGDMVGWNTDSPLEIQYKAFLDEENRPCIALEYNIKYNPSKF